MEKHLDLIRNDLVAEEQSPVARIYVDPDSYGLIVKDEVEHWEGNVFDALGEVARGPGDRIIEMLRQVFNGPYLVVTDAHFEADCPFQAGHPLPITREQVTTPYVLPYPEPAG